VAVNAPKLVAMTDAERDAAVVALARLLADLAADTDLQKWLATAAPPTVADRSTQDDSAPGRGQGDDPGGDWLSGAGSS
jgi:hypothetical protein